MTLTVASSIDVAKRLQDLDDISLRAVLDERISDPGLLKDYYDVADALLSPASIQRALRHLTGEQLLSLQDFSSASPDVTTYMVSQLLTSSDGTQVYPEVLALLDDDVLRVATPRDLPPHVEGLVAQAAMEHALTHITALDDVLYDIERAPLKTLANGNASAKDIQRYSSLIPTDTSLMALLQLAKQSGLARHSSKWWVVTEAYPTWQQLPLDKRWMSCAQSWLEHLSRGVRTVMTTSPTLPPQQSWLDEQFPLGHSWLDKPVAEAIDSATTLGLVVSGTRSATGSAVLEEDWDTVAKNIEAATPHMVDTLFIQHDFTVVAPGPLVPELNHLMRILCQVESRGVASTYRITAEGVDNVFAQGKTAEDILTTLSTACAAGVPQAVEYFLTERSERFRSILLTTDGTDTLITCRDELLATMLLNDRNLRMLRLSTHTPVSLRCSHPEHVVLRTLRDAKYSAQLEASTSSSSGASSVSTDTGSFQVLFSRLRSIASQDITDEASWIGRQLELALREKVPVWVSVSMPDGSRDFLVEIKGIANGRLRCLDRQTEVERTLPASHITAVKRDA